MRYVTDDRGRRRWVTDREYLEIQRKRRRDQLAIYNRWRRSRLGDGSWRNRTDDHREAADRTMSERSSGYDRAEQNRFDTLSDINSRDRVMGAGGSGVRGLDDGLGLNASREDVEDYIRARYGYFAAFMDIPEVGEVLREAALHGWGENELRGALYDTEWWQTTDAAQRTWTRLQAEDPAEAQRQIRQTAATVMNRARGLGLPSSIVADIATQATVNGWTTEEQIDALIASVDWNTLEGGNLTALRDEVNHIGAEYLVGVHEQTARNYAERIASGELTLDGVRSIMLKQAKARFSWMADQLDAGVTVADYLAPVRDRIASELEITPDDVNLMDPQWLSLVETKGDDGKMRAATLHEATLAARKRPEWKNTANAQRTTTQLMSTLGQVFGRSGV